MTWTRTIAKDDYHKILNNYKTQYNKLRLLKISYQDKFSIV